MRNWKQIAKLFVVGVKDFKFSQEMKSFFNEFPTSGVALFNSPFDSPDNIWRDRDASLEAVYEFNQKILQHVHFISADQEGGRVRRLRGSFLHLPAAQVFAEQCQSQENKTRAYHLFRLAAQQMKHAGIQLNFAPVCDLQTSESNDVVGDRSFSRNPSEVVEWCQRFCAAFKSESVATTLKHFPGHGPSRMDSHERPALIEKPDEIYRKEDVEIFKKLMPQADLLMTGHLSFLERPEAIVSITPKLIEDFLKDIPERLPLITDDLLSMKAVSDQKPWLKAFDGPYSFILLCGDLHKSFEAIEETIRYAESRLSTFSHQQDLEKRLQRSQDLFRTNWTHTSFDRWKSEMLTIEKEGLEILSALNLVNHA